MDNEKKKRNWKREAKDVWDRCWPYIKTGGTCLFIGFVYGFIKGNEASNNMWLTHGFERAQDDSDDMIDDFVYDESNVDDPELLDIIRSESVEE